MPEPERTAGFLKKWFGDSGGALFCLFVLITLACMAELVFRWGGEKYQLALSNIASIVVFVGPAVLAFRTSRHPYITTRARWAWTLIAAANSSFSIGSAVWLYFENVIGKQPFPSPADFGFLAFYPLTLAGLLLLVEKMRSAEERLNFTLDAGVILLAGGMALWYFLMEPMARAATDPLRTALAIAYPIGDLVLLLGISSLMLRRAEFGSRLPVNILLAGLVVNFAYDFIFAYQNLAGTYVSGSLVDALFAVPSIPLMLAAHIYYVRGTKDSFRSDPRFSAKARYFWVPYLAIGAVFFILLKVNGDGRYEHLTEFLWVSALVAALVTFRQFMFLRENVKANIALNEVQQRIQGIFSASTDAIALADLSGTITEVNDSFLRFTGFGREEIVGTMKYQDFLPASHLEESIAPENGPDDERPIEYEQELTRKDGTCRTVTAALFAVNGGGGAPAAIALVMRDITDRRVLESRLTHQALHDPLTGLANRVLLSQRVTAALSRARRMRSNIAVMFLDLDNFKNVNDTLGHAAGDSLLVTVADRLRNCLRQTDTPARLGGDEFAILVEDILNPHEELIVADRILSAVRAPVEVDGKHAFVGASIGIALSSASVVRPEDLLTNADVAMYAAKREGKNRYFVYEDSMHAAVIRRAELEADLRLALEREEFHLCFQPIVDLETGFLVAAETLVRWDHPRGLAVGPAEFIGIAEEASLIGQLGQWVLTEACKRAAGWQRQFSDLEPFALTVNVSSREFMDPSFVDTMKSAYLSAGLPPERLVIEITESSILVNTDATIKKLNEVRSLGVKLAVDDFGTGYSSLSYLNRFPMNILKIDRSFVEKVDDGEGGAAMAKAVISMSDTLKLTTIAEGIESYSQIETLRELGCSWGQGFYFSKPLTVDEMEKYLEECGLVGAFAGGVLAGCAAREHFAPAS